MSEVNGTFARGDKLTQDKKNENSLLLDKTEATWINTQNYLAWQNKIKSSGHCYCLLMLPGIPLKVRKVIFRKRSLIVHHVSTPGTKGSKKQAKIRRRMLKPSLLEIFAISSSFGLKLIHH